MTPTAASPRKQPALTLTRLLRPHWKGLTLAFLAVLGETATGLAEPWPIKVIVDNVLQSKQLPPWLQDIAVSLFGQNKFTILYFAVVAVAVIAVVGAASSYAEKYLTTSVSQWVTHDLRRTLYNHIQRLSLVEYDKTRTGDLIARVTGDIEAIQDFISSALLGMLVNVLTIVGMVGVMFWIDWRFALIALSVTPPLFVVVYFFTRSIKAASRAVRKKQSELLSDVQEVLTSERVVKAFAREDYEVHRFESQSLANVETALRARNIKASLGFLVEIIVAIGTCLVLGFGGQLALNGRLSAGVLIMFVLYLGKMYKPMRDLSKMTDTISKALIGYERIEEVLEIESQVRDRSRARRAPRFSGRIEFDRVSFGYAEDVQVLSDISLRIEPGHVAALVGPSGSGKTTIISLIPRFYDPKRGQVRIDGHDIRQFKLKSLRDQISFVLQDTLLFRTSIWENIAYGKPDASRDEIIRAAELANAHEFIEKMPEGYDSVVGERGATLSGGQRQRIAIARAVIRNAPILLLDEPTSGLDEVSVQAVFEALDRLMKGRTSVIVAHHLHTIQQADVIFVINDNVLAEQGTHAELLAKGGVYADFYKLQTAETADRLVESPAAAGGRLNRDDKA
jgi:subfamily B ATP-binding cassette protein MsbA